MIELLKKEGKARKQKGVSRVILKNVLRMRIHGSSERYRCWFKGSIDIIFVFVLFILMELIQLKNEKKYGAVGKLSGSNEF